MVEQQTSFPLEIAYSPAPAAAPELRDEIAQLWALPLGQRVEVCLRGRGATPSAATGTLELQSAPDYPWNPKQPLRLCVAGLEFSSRDIERWTKV